MQVFEQIDVPREHRRATVNKYANWYTWTGEARKLIAGCEGRIPSRRAVRLVPVDGRGEYSCSYSIAHSRSFDALSTALRPLALALFRIRVPRRIMLFHRLFDRSIRRETFPAVLACVRDILAELSHDRLAALYPPLVDAKGADSGFELHADLYRAPVLCNVFDEVAPRSEGASLFLPVTEFCRLVREEAGVPDRARSRLLNYFSTLQGRDHFNEFYATLYGRSSWQTRLAAKMSASQLTIKLKRGEGYLLHDRIWLHGRTATSKGISGSRLHRLVFTTETILRRRVPG
jgi:hypothetical protein